MGTQSVMLTKTRLSFAFALVLPLSINSQENYETYQFPQNHDPYRWFLNFVDPNIQAKHLYIRQDVAPVEGHFLFPNISGKYPWIDFQHGFLGEFPEMVYSEWITTLVQLGFAVSYGMPHNSNPHDFAPADNFTAWNTWNGWIRDNINDFLVENADEIGKDVQIDVDNLGMMCHADGCDMTKEFMIQYPEIAKAYYFLDPVYSFDNVDVSVKLDTHQSVVVAQTDMCNQCCEANYNFDTRTFESISGMEIKTFQKLHNKGHCSAFNYWFMDNCRKGLYCKMPRMQMNEARQFHRDLTGWVTALMTHAFFERRDMTKYFTDVNKMPNNFLVDGEIECQSDKVPSAC